MIHVTYTNLKFLYVFAIFYITFYKSFVSFLGLQRVTFYCCELVVLGLFYWITLSCIITICVNCI